MYIFVIKRVEVVTSFCTTEQVHSPGPDEFLHEAVKPVASALMTKKPIRVFSTPSCSEL